jgi:methyl-accepting chemotaxis protein
MLMNFSSLRQISIRARLYLLGGTITLLLLIPFTLLVQDYQDDLMDAKQTKTRHLVESTTSLLNYFYQQQTRCVLFSCRQKHEH